MSKGVRIHVEGLRDIQRGLRSIDKTLPRQMRRELNDVVEVVASKARADVPVVSGALRDSIKPRSTQREGRVSMGTPARVPYAGWIEFGGNRPHRRPYQPGGRYLFPAGDDAEPEVLRRLSKMIVKLGQVAGII